MDSLKTAHLYRLIQSFLKGDDYLALMNCNHAMFDDIKRETIKFGKYAHNVGKEGMVKIIKVVGKMCQRVAAPSKQITLKIEEIYAEAISLMGIMVQNLYRLSIDTHFVDDWDIDFTMFNNIPILELSGRYGLTKIQSGLQNIQRLSLNLSKLIECYNFNSSNSLKYLKIVANKLTSLPVRTNFNETFQMIVEEGEIWDSNRLTMEFDLKGNMLCLSSLFLSGNFLNTHLGMDRLLTADRVSFRHWNRNNYSTARPLLPYSFPCKYLSIVEFTLSAWPVGLLLPNLRILELTNCIGPQQLPEMPELTSLSLNEVSNITEIRTFPRCVNMSLISIKSLTFIDRQPMLRNLTLSGCPSFRHLLDGQRFAKLYFQKPLSDMDMKWARNTWNLSTSEVKCIRSFAGYERSDIPVERKRCIFRYFNNVDLTGLSGMGEVRLESSSSFGTTNDLTQLSNIGDLRIQECWNFSSTRNIHNIRERLCIDRCGNLQKLEGLQGIPDIMLGALPKVDDISGLGNHEHVYVFNVPYLIDCAVKYRRVKDNSELRSALPYASIFDTIKSFYILIDCVECEYSDEDDSDSSKDDDDDDCDDTDDADDSDHQEEDEDEDEDEIEDGNEDNNDDEDEDEDEYLIEWDENQDDDYYSKMKHMRLSLDWWELPWYKRIRLW